jgi:hypothetical protein
MKMKLSEAIREGSKRSGQARGTFVLGNDACALGAVMLTTGIMDEMALFRALPGLIEPREINCKGMEGPFLPPRTLAHAIMQLNDYQRWSREEIADWLEKSGYDFDIPPAPAPELRPPLYWQSLSLAAEDAYREWQEENSQRLRREAEEIYNRLTSACALA